MPELSTLGATIKTALTTGNDGPGSGLDADLLDGQHGTAFATLAQGTTADAALPRAGGTVTGPLTLGTGASVNGGDKVASALELRDIAETVVAKGTISGGVTFDFSAGGYQWGTTSSSTNITSVTVTNPPASGKAGTLTIEIIQNGTTARTITWGAAFRFPGGADFQLTQVTGAVDIFVLVTRDGGATWRVAEGGKDFAA